MHYLHPTHASARVAVYYRNFAAATDSAYSHVGLGVSGVHTVRVLRSAGIQSDVFGVWTVDQITPGSHTHAILEAPWIESTGLSKLSSANPGTHLVVRSHSQIGFLQVEAGAIKIVRDVLAMQDSSLNLSLAANSKRLQRFLESTYGGRCIYLPNLYDYIRPEVRRYHRTSGPLRISSFGALRLLKNHTTNAAAAMLIARRLGRDLEFYCNVNRQENPGSQGILQSLRNMFAGVHWAKLIESPWENWSTFRQRVSNMDLCLQLSFTESFNVVTADALAEGVPVVVSPAIDWVPAKFQANPDDAEAIASVGCAALSDPFSGQDGRDALIRHCDSAKAEWISYLNKAPHMA